MRIGRRVLSMMICGGRYVPWISVFGCDVMTATDLSYLPTIGASRCRMVAAAVRFSNIHGDGGGKYFCPA